MPGNARTLANLIQVFHSTNILTNHTAWGFDHLPLGIIWLLVRRDLYWVRISSFVRSSTVDDFVAIRSTRAQQNSTCFTISVFNPRDSDLL
jgi:hypothetical protein